jgi:hypothetical protein
VAGVILSCPSVRPTANRNTARATTKDDLMVAPATKSCKSSFSPPLALQLVAHAAADIDVAATTLARLAQQRDSAALAGDALRVQSAAELVVKLVPVLAWDLGTAMRPPPGPPRCTCPTCAPWGAEPFVDLRDIPPAVRRG